MRIVALATLVALLGLVAFAAAGSGGWQNPKTISAAGEDGRDPAVATGADGTTAVAWRRFDGTNPPNCCFRIQVAVRRGNGKLGKAKTISPPGESAAPPQASVGSDGTIAVIWTAFDLTQPPFTCCRIVRAAIRRPGHQWSKAQQLSAGGQDAMDVSVGVGDDGAAVATWAREDSDLGDRRLQARFRAPGGAAASFKKLQTLSPDGESAYAPHLAVAPDGTAAAVWQRNDGSNDRTVVRVRKPGKRFGARRNLSKAGDESDYHTVAVGAGGDFIAAWEVETAGSEYRIQTRRAGGGGKFGKTKQLTANATSDEPALAVDGNGRATVAWEDLDAERITLRTSNAAGKFGKPRFLSNDGAQTTGERLATNEAGDTALLWRQFFPTDPPFCCQVVFARIRREGHRLFGAQEPLSSQAFGAGDVSVAVGPPGNAIAAWQTDDGSDDRVQVATYRP